MSSPSSPASIALALAEPPARLPDLRPGVLVEDLGVGVVEREVAQPGVELLGAGQLLLREGQESLEALRVHVGEPFDLRQRLELLTELRRLLEAASEVGVLPLERLRHERTEFLWHVGEVRTVEVVPATAAALAALLAGGIASTPVGGLEQEGRLCEPADDVLHGCGSVLGPEAGLALGSWVLRRRVA
jgi:hypothetical protein